MMIVKIGGGASINLEAIVEDLAKQTEPFIIVHGANAARDQLLERLGQQKQVVTSVSGFSSVFSDDTLLESMMMAYAGLKNKQLVELFQKQGINAVGLSGIDGRLIQGQRNKGIRVERDGKKILLHDRSGKPACINSELLQYLLDNRYIPVLCVPIVDEQGVAINAENDEIVVALQKALSAETIVHLIEAPGFLKDPKLDQSMIDRLSLAELRSYRESSQGRIKRKLLAIEKLFQDSKPKVFISDGRIQNPIQSALAGKGTEIRYE